MATVLLISSFVADGRVGLQAMAPALNRLGLETIALPTIVLSNHAGYRRLAGEAVAAPLLDEMLLALEGNGRLDDVVAVASGYLARAEQAEVVRKWVVRLNGRRKVLFACDPVIGDLPKGLYVAREIAEAIRDRLLPLADLATPNRFELSWLAGESGSPDLAAAIARAQSLMDDTDGSKALVVTSAEVSEEEVVTVLARGLRRTSCRVARRASVPHGTGDLLAALLIGYALGGLSWPAALERAVTALDAVLGASAGRDAIDLCGGLDRIARL